MKVPPALDSRASQKLIKAIKQTTETRPAYPPTMVRIFIRLSSFPTLMYYS